MDQKKALTLLNHYSKISKLQAAWERIKQIQVAEIMGGSDLDKWRLSECTVGERNILFKCTKEFRERGKFAKVVYRLILY